MVLEKKKVTEYIKSMIEYYENGELLNVIDFFMGSQQLPRPIGRAWAMMMLMFQVITINRIGPTEPSDEAVCENAKYNPISIPLFKPENVGMSQLAM
jgi:hypothetical protein